jgi:hypothetical protein
MPTINPIIKYPSNRVHNLCDQYFGKLHVIGFFGFNRRKQAQWLCQCDCSKWTIVSASNLRHNHTRSCGCLVSEKVIARCTTHGQASKNNPSPAYASYCSALGRCTNPNDPAYINYGGRGIEFRFISFEEFFAELGECPKYLTLDRIDNDGHYEKGNVRWATRAVQNRNRSSNVYITILGKTQVLIDWAKDFQIKRETISRRRRTGWCDECSVTIKPNNGTCTHR